MQNNKRSLHWCVEACTTLLNSAAADTTKPIRTIRTMRPINSIVPCFRALQSEGGS